MKIKQEDYNRFIIKLIHSQNDTLKRWAIELAKKIIYKQEQ